jgi:hypothetical protein
MGEPWCWIGQLSIIVISYLQWPRLHVRGEFVRQRAPTKPKDGNNNNNNNDNNVAATVVTDDDMLARYYQDYEDCDDLHETNAVSLHKPVSISCSGGHLFIVRDTNGPITVLKYPSLESAHDRYDADVRGITPFADSIVTTKSDKIYHFNDDDEDDVDDKTNNGTPTSAAQTTDSRSQLWKVRQDKPNVDVNQPLVLVTEHRYDHICVVRQADLSIVREFGSEGSPEFNGPTRMCVDDYQQQLWLIQSEYAVNF